MAGRRIRPAPRTNVALVVLAGVGLVAVAFLVVRRGPADTNDAVPSASVPDGWQAFTSARYGFDVSVPAEWRVSVEPGSAGLHPGEPGLDSFLGPNRQLGIVAIAVETTLEGWVSPITAHYEGSAADGHTLTPDATEPITLGGHGARLTTYHFEIPPYVTLVLEAELVVDGQGYMLTFLGLAQQDAADRALFDQILSSFRLTD